MNYPDKEFCMNLFDKYKVPENIKKHCITVSKLGKFLAEKANLDTNLIESACLLHDVMKSVTLKTLEKNEKLNYSGPSEEELEVWKNLKEKYSNMHETEIIYEILKEDYPEFAKFMLDVGKIHEVSDDIRIVIVQYSDMRSKGDEIVSIQERIEDLKTRYKFDEKWWQAELKFANEREKVIIKKLGISPNDVNNSIL